MERLQLVQHHASQIRNAAWLVRHYCRPIHRKQRAAAVLELGRVVRAAFNACEDFEPLLIAILEGLKPQDYTRPF